MKLSLSRIEDDVEIKRFEVEFDVKYFYKLSKKDREKIYKILRIMDSLGSDEIDETTDKDYRYQSDQEDDDEKTLLDGIIKDGRTVGVKKIEDDIDLKSEYKRKKGYTK